MLRVAIAVGGVLLLSLPATSEAGCEPTTHDLMGVSRDGLLTLTCGTWFPRSCLCRLHNRKAPNTIKCFAVSQRIVDQSREEARRRALRGVRRYIASRYRGDRSKEIGWWGHAGLRSPNDKYRIEASEDRFFRYLEVVEIGKNRRYPLTARRKSFFPDPPKAATAARGSGGMYSALAPCLPKFNGFCVKKIDWTKDLLRVVIGFETSCGEKARLYEVPYATLHRFKWDRAPQRGAQHDQAKAVVHSCIWTEIDHCYFKFKETRPRREYRCVYAASHAVRERYHQANFSRSVPRQTGHLLNDLESTASELASDYSMFRSVWGRDKKTRIANVKAARTSGVKYLHQLIARLTGHRDDPALQRAVRKRLRRRAFRNNLTRLDPGLMGRLQRVTLPRSPANR